MSNNSEQSRKSVSVDLLSTEPETELREHGVTVRKTSSPLATRSLGDLGIAYRISAKDRFPDSFLRIDFEPEAVPWIDPGTIRFFWLEPRSRDAKVVWRSGANIGLGYLWARVGSPGTYVAVGLPRDRVLLETLRTLANRTRIDGNTSDGEMLIGRSFRELFEAGEELDRLRAEVTQIEFAAGTDQLLRDTVRRGRGYGIEAPVLPGGVENFGDLAELLDEVDVETGLPEFELFFPPGGFEPLPWPPEPRPTPIVWPWPWEPRISILKIIPDWLHLLCLTRWRDWPVYMHDAQHTGRAQCSAINSSNVSTLRGRHTVPLPDGGRIVSQPAIVWGRAYIGSMDATSTSAGGHLYKVNLATGSIEGSFPVSSRPGRHGTGIASTPAIVAGKAYISSLSGHLYRVDTTTMLQDWVVDLRVQDLAHNQPVTNSSIRAAGWSSPVVANGKVYVGHGEGETAGHGYVFCVDADTGNVVWLTCTNKFKNPNSEGPKNQPNVLPPSDWTGPGSPPAPYSLAPNDPENRGSSPWSSVAYDSVLDRVYVGTGNATPDNPLPDPFYASGCLSLDASDGKVKGFFQPLPTDSYRPADDYDIDVPGGPTVFTRNGERLVGIGSKNGSYFLLNADTMDVVERRQLLPYDSGGNPFPAVDPPQSSADRENRYGVFGTAAVDSSRETLFIGLGGYSSGIDSATTPFIRAMDWNDLSDAWPTGGTNPPKYSLAQPPVYMTSGEAGLTNVASVNDVVFVGTTKPGLYALDADTGFCLWTAGWTATWGRYCFGVAVSGSYVAAGHGNHLYIYSL